MNYYINQCSSKLPWGQARPFFCCLLLLCGFSAIFAQSTVEVVDTQSGEPLSYAAIYDESNQYYTYTDEAGRALLPNYVDRFTVSYVGYAPAVFETVRPYLLVKLVPAADLPTVELVARKNNNWREGNSSYTLRTPELKEVPALLGEFDPIKALTFLPGISGGTEGTAAISIRGGNANQTALLIDGQQVYNVNHIGGYLSAIPEFGVQSIRVHKGAIPARYGGRLSGVLDVVLREGDKEAAKYQLGIGTALLKGSVEGPIGNKVSYLFSGRVGYPTLVNDLISASQYERRINGIHTTLRLYDGIGKVSFRDGDWALALNIFTSGDNGFDQFDFSNQFVYEDFNWSNRLIGVQASRQLGQRLALKVGTGISQYGFRFANFENTLDASEVVETTSSESDQAISDWRSYARAIYQLGDNQQIEFGVEHISRDLTQAFQAIDREDSLIARVNLRDENSETSAFINYDWADRSGRFGFMGGLRATRYANGRFETNRLEPRLKGTFQINRSLAINMGYDRNSQFGHELITALGLLPNSVWVIASDSLPPASSEQFFAGISGTFDKDRGYNWSLEAFYKTFDELVRVQPGFESELAAGQVSRLNGIASGGIGEARGLEAYFEKASGALQFKLAYTLMYSDRTYPTVNGGQTFPFTFDRRHDLSALLSYRANVKWAFSAQFIYQSGYAITLPIGQSARFDIYDGFNNARFPPFHVLNLAVRKHWRGKKNKTHEHELSFTIYNLYNRANAFAVGRRPEFSPIIDPVTMQPSFTVRSVVGTRSILGIVPGISYSRSISGRSKTGG